MHQYMFKRALVILSGGQDSTTCLFLAKLQANNVRAITFDYGQRHSIEIGAAATIAGLAGVPHELIPVGPYVLAGTSPLVNAQQHVEEYPDAASLPGGIEKTFVPMRNALFLTIAANRAAVHGCDAIYIGVSQEDYGGYPDCRSDFLLEVQDMIDKALGEAVLSPPRIIAPLLQLNKRETVELAYNELDVACWEALAHSHTCYNGVFPPCGKCHACLLREKGFVEAGVDDPLMRRAQDIRAMEYREAANRG